ncbi:MAG: hypothetical protein AAGB32_02295 [Pseudomonadota bacterium]
MSDDNTPIELTEEQIALGKAFNEAAALFMRKLNREWQLGNMAERNNSIGNMLSRIGTEVAVAMTEKRKFTEGDMEFYQAAIRRGAQVYAPDIEDGMSMSSKRELRGKIKNSILLNLFTATYQDDGRVTIPKEVVQKGHPDFDTPKLI